MLREVINMKKTNKFSKGKTVGIVAASLAAVSLIGVGFSTWIISNTNKEQTGDITVNVADTKDMSVMISNATVDTNDNSVNFDADEEKMNKAEGHILSCSKGDKEDLTFTLTYKVTVSADAGSWQIKAAINDTDDKKFNAAINTKKYIALPATLGLTEGVECLSKKDSTSDAIGTGATVSSASDTTDSTKMVYTVSQKFTFTWGLAFANKNPVEVITSDKIYGQNDTGDTASTTATQETLTANTKAMKALDLDKFTVTLSVGTVSLKS